MVIVRSVLAMADVIGSVAMLVFVVVAMALAVRFPRSQFARRCDTR